MKSHANTILKDVQNLFKCEIKFRLIDKCGSCVGILLLLLLIFILNIDHFQYMMRYMAIVFLVWRCQYLKYSILII